MRIINSLLVFYLLIGLPLLVLGLLTRNHAVRPTQFVILLASYVFVYHPLICGLRLLANGKVTTKEFYRTFIPLWNFRYFNFLFFNK